MAKVSAVLGLGVAALYSWFLGELLYSLYSPTRGFCATPEVMALTSGAFVAAPIALLLVVAIARFGVGIATQRTWRAISVLAATMLLVAAGANWLILLRFVAF